MPEKSKRATPNHSKKAISLGILTNSKKGMPDSVPQGAQCVTKESK